MSEADDFRLYAEEAMRWAAQSTIEREKKSLFDVARIWSQAAQAAEDVKPPEHAGR
jgi:hypothetical protein